MKCIDLLAIAALSGALLLPKVQGVTIDFDALDATGGEVTGTPLDNYLAQYGVTISNVTGGPILGVADDRLVYGGGALAATSPYNLLVQSGNPSATISNFTFNFSTPQSSVSFTRVAITVSSLMPIWSAQAYDSDSQPVGSSVGEGSFSGTESAAIFTLTGGNITSVTWVGNAFGAAGYDNAPIDNLVLPSTTVPEPSTTGVILGAAALGAVHRRRKRAT